MLINISIILLSYLLGSIASAVLICRIFGLTDPRSDGSLNPGTTNVMRLHGKKMALLTLICDVLKGFAPVFIASLIGCADLIIALCGCAAFLGHLFPLFFKFQGGKGVATLIGILFASHWLLGIAYIATWLVIALLSRYSSLAAIVATVLNPLYCWLVLGSPSILISYILIAILLIWRHRTNIHKLINGTENKLLHKSR